LSQPKSCPYCEIRPTHAGYSFIQTHFKDAKAEKKFVFGCTVKSRQEPCHILQVAEIITHLQKEQDMNMETVCNVCYENSLQLFGLGEKIK
jgi:TatD DNase family protein